MLPGPAGLERLVVGSGGEPCPGGAEGVLQRLQGRVVQTEKFVAGGEGWLHALQTGPVEDSVGVDGEAGQPVVEGELRSLDGFGHAGFECPQIFLHAPFSGLKQIAKLVAVRSCKIR